MLQHTPEPQGHFVPAGPLQWGKSAVLEAIQHLEQPFALVRGESGVGAGFRGVTTLGGPPTSGALPLLAWVPALPPERLGDPSFQMVYGTRYSYVAGEMANGIGSAEMVIAMAKAGMIGFFGSGGLSTERVRTAVERIQSELGDLPYGFNLIHSPQDPRQEQALVDLYLEKGVRTVCAAAFMSLTPAVVHYRAAGLSRNGSEIHVSNRLIAKVSREEVATHFLAPAPEKILRALVEQGKITAEQAELARQVPMADDLTAEADSGGHTDNRASFVLIPLMLMLRDRMRAEHGYTQIVRVGAAGGISTPQAVAAAFALGAAYVVTGTVNQACIEAGTSDLAKSLLAQAGAADVDMAPASDMFEAGVKVQVLKRGTMFSRRGERLYEIWREYSSLDAIPSDERQKLEEQILRRPAEDVWKDCVSFFSERDPAQLERAEREPKHKLALIFRWYLGMSSRWAIAGVEDRKLDTQIWCGPAIGAFNAWTRGTFLAEPANRRVATVAANLLAGAAAITRSRWLNAQGIDLGPEALAWTPRPINE